MSFLLRYSQALARNSYYVSQFRSLRMAPTRAIREMNVSTTKAEIPDGKKEDIVKPVEVFYRISEEVRGVLVPPSLSFTQIMIAIQQQEEKFFGNHIFVKEISLTKKIENPIIIDEDTTAEEIYKFQTDFKKENKENKKLCYLRVSVIEQQQSASVLRSPVTVRANDGVILGAPVTLSRHETVGTIVSLLQTYQSILIKSMPGSGKTSLLQLVQSALLLKTKKVYYFTFRDPDSVKEFQNFYHTLPKNSSSKPEDRSYFLLDDVQSQYGDKDFFNQFLPGINNNLSNDISNFKDSSIRNAHFLLASTYQLKKIPETPFSPGKILTYDDIKLQKTEQVELFSKILDDKYPEYLRIDPKMKVFSDISQLCGGHVFLLTHFFFNVVDLFNFQRTLQDVLDLENSVIYFRNYAKWLPRVWASTLDITNSEKESLKLIVLTNTVDFSIPTQRRIVLQLLRAFFVEDTELLRNSIESNSQVEFKFSFPLAKYVLYSYAFPPTTRFPTGATINQFIRMVVTMFTQSDILMGSGKAGTLPTEYFFQNLFFHYAVQILPEKCHLHVSENLGNGKVDFYLNSCYHWAIELLVDGEQIKEHLGRFKQSNEFRSTTNYEHPQNWVVVDFWNGDKRTPTFRKPHTNRARDLALRKVSNYISVQFRNNYKNVLISQNQNSEEYILGKKIF